MTIKEALQTGGRTLRHITETPELDSTWLLLSVCGQTDVTWLLTHGDDELSPGAAARFQTLLAARGRGKPVAYLLGEWQFFGRDFLITEDVLVPRPETEELIREALLVIRQHARNQRPLVVADIGTGSGCIAVTLALEAPTAIEHIYATDISAAALAVAARNAKRHQVEHRISFRRGNLLEPLRGTPIDLVVSNPPYVPAAELKRARFFPARATAGLAFEPPMALDGGPDGERYSQQLKTTGIPTIVEVTGGAIKRFNCSSLQSPP